MVDKIKLKKGTRLDQALKLSGVAGTGGEAKLMIQGGHVLVNSKIETRRGHRLSEGDIIEVDDVVLVVEIS